MLDSLLAGFVAAVVAWAQPYAQQHGYTLTTQQTHCLVEAEYYESRGEGNTGIAAVAYTILNRTVTRDKSICGVIHEHKQFSYYNPHHERHAHEAVVWVESTFIAVYAQLGLITNPVGNATMYNTEKMRSWLDDARYLMRVNHHHFYVMKADLDQPYLYPKPVATVPLSRLHVECLLTDPQCDPLYHRAGLVIDPRLRAILSLPTDTPPPSGEDDEMSEPVVVRHHESQRLDRVSSHGGHHVRSERRSHVPRRRC